MAGILLFLKALPWKQIRTALAGALVLAFLAAPWFLWRLEVKDHALTGVELEKTEKNLAEWKTTATAAIENRERIETALDDVNAATLKLGESAAGMRVVTEAAAIRAAELAEAREEIADLRTAAAELRHQAQNLTYCETNALVIASIAEGP